MWIIIPENVRFIFHYSSGKFLKFIFPKSPCQKYSTVWICNSADTKETMTRAILFEAFRVLFLEIHFGVCTTFHIKILRLHLCTVALCCRCVAMLGIQGGWWEQGSSSTDQRAVGNEMLGWAARPGLLHPARGQSWGLVGLLRVPGRAQFMLDKIQEVAEKEQSC